MFAFWLAIRRGGITPACKFNEIRARMALTRTGMFLVNNPDLTQAEKVTGTSLDWRDG